MTMTKEMTKGKKAGLVALAALCCLINTVVALTGDMLSILSSVWLTGAVFAACILMIPSRFLLVVPIVSATALILLNMNAPTVLLSIAFAPCGALIAMEIIKKHPKRSAMLKMGGALMMMAFAAFIIIVWDNQGTFTAESIRAFYDELLELFKTQLEAAADGKVNPESIDMMIANCQNSSVWIPGLVFAFMAAIGLVGASMTWLICYWFGQQKALFSFDAKWEVSFSKAAAVLFIVSFAAIFFDSLSGASGGKAFYAIVYTIFYPMSLAMIHTGIRTIHRWFSRTKAMKFIAVLILVFAFFVAPQMCFSLTIMVGVYTILSGRDKKPMEY